MVESVREKGRRVRDKGRDAPGVLFVFCKFRSQFRFFPLKTTSEQIGKNTDRDEGSVIAHHGREKKGKDDAD